METVSTKQIGVWMDHSKAHFVGYKEGKAFLIESVDSPYERIKREDGEVADKARFGSEPFMTSNNENKKHNITQNEINEYFKILEGKLKNYEDILLFGPSTAKDQLINRLSGNKSFDGKWVSVQSSDKLSENQLLAFVREFFKS